MTHDPTGRFDRRDLLVALALAGLVVILYARTATYSFVELDDTLYITMNQHVAMGLSAQNIRWALTTGHEANWSPLTWLSYQAEVTLAGGPRPGVHHTSNFILHALNSVLLFGALRALTGARWRSAAVAALFAVHPMHVESVAWIAERKDVLAGLFAFAALWAYARYAHRPSPARYAVVLVLLALGLASKPMVVTLPAIMLLLDIWPLDRWRDAAQRRLVVLEKLPMFVLVGAASAWAYAVQQQGGALAGGVPLHARISNAILAYVGYLRRLVQPTDLALPYPHPLLPGQSGLPPAHLIALALALLLAITLAALLLALRARLRAPIVGWLWFVGAMLPMSGLVQFSTHAMADRFAYLPYVGLYIAIVWLAAEVADRVKFNAPERAGVMAVVLVALGLLTWRQVGHWRDTFTLFNHTIAVTDNNAHAHYYMGIAHAKAGAALLRAGHTGQAHQRYEAAMAQYDAALAINPDDVKVVKEKGTLMFSLGRFPEGIDLYLQVLRRRPGDADVRARLLLVAAALEGEGQRDDAQRVRDAVERIRP